MQNNNYSMTQQCDNYHAMPLALCKNNEERSKALLHRFSAIINNGQVVGYRSNQEAAEAFKAHYYLPNAEKLVTGERVNDCFPTLRNKPESPTLNVVSLAFGEEVVTQWMLINIDSVSNAVGLKNISTPLQNLAISSSLKEKFNNEVVRLNVREILLFFFKIISGDLGRFYGQIDAITMGDMANTFLEWRRARIIELDEEDQRNEALRRYDEMVANAVPCPKDFNLAKSLEGIADKMSF